jgi:dTDP-4-amino-4,6-dideoxygalactose transaminase
MKVLRKPLNISGVSMMRKITLGYLNISDRGKKYVNEVLGANRLSRGKFTEKFEREFAALHDCKHAIFMNSGTSALQVSLAALKEVHGYKNGDEVIVPATTFIATSNIVLQNNMKPIFVDVDPNTFNINRLDILSALTSRTRCIIPVHLLGLPADMNWVMKVAEVHKLQVIEDSCETMFASCGGRSVGSFGDLACFSAYVAHLIVGGVGGLVTTNNDQLAEICRSLMAHGRDSIYTNIDQDDSDDKDLRRQMIERRFRFERVGYSYRCTEMEAAIALSELQRWRSNIATRRKNANLLNELLYDLSNHLQLPTIPDSLTHSFMMYALVLKDGNRDNLLMYLEERGIETRYLFPLLSQPIYREMFPKLEDNYPVAQHLAAQGFYIGMHQGLNKLDIEYISEVIHGYFQESE